MDLVDNALATADAARHAQQALGDDATRRFQDDVLGLVRAFLRTARRWFDANAPWDLERMRAELPMIRRVTDELAERIALRFDATTRNVRRQAAIRAANLTATELKRLGEPIVEPHIAVRSHCLMRRRRGEHVTEAWSVPESIERLREAYRTIAFSEPPDSRTMKRRVARVLLFHNGKFCVLNEDAYHKAEDYQRFADVRAEHPHGVHNSLPGGGCDDAESFQSAAIRETLEETGQRVELERWLCDLVDEYAVRRYYLATPLGEVVGDRTIVDHDGHHLIDVRWVDPRKAQLSSAYDRAALTQVVRNALARTGPDRRGKERRRTSTGTSLPVKYHQHNEIVKESTDMRADRKNLAAPTNRQMRVRVQAILDRHLLPSVQALARIEFTDLRGVHGEYENGVVYLNPAIFVSNDFFDPPYGGAERIDRVTHTVLHEFMHALGEKTGADSSPEWLALGGWKEFSWRFATTEQPLNTTRYVERRPGWIPGPSPWVHRIDAWLTRDYAGKSPQEFFADAATWLLVGWADQFGDAGIAVRNYVAKVLQTAGVSYRAWVEIEMASPSKSKSA